MMKWLNINHHPGVIISNMKYKGHNKNAWLHNTTIGFYFGGSSAENNMYPHTIVDHPHTQVNMVSVRPSGNIFEFETTFRQMN